jgi:hypothetical protein
MLLVETINLTKRYGPRAVVDHVGLQVRRGEVYGFLGPRRSPMASRPRSRPRSWLRHLALAVSLVVVRARASAWTPPPSPASATGQRSLRRLRPSSRHP